MLTTNHSYLVRRYPSQFLSSSPIVKTKVLSITEKCYEIEWQIGNRVWMLKTDFDQNWEIIEDIGDPTFDQIYSTFKSV